MIGSNHDRKLPERPTTPTAYDSEALRDKLASMEIDQKIVNNARRRKPLKHRQVWFNNTASSVCVGVERYLGLSATTFNPSPARRT
jgi:hypothetical protein